MTQVLFPPPIDGETQKAYNAFRQYCLMGDERSLRKVAQERRNSGITHLARWSAKNRWQERVAMFDEVRLLAELDADEIARADMRAKRRALLTKAIGRADKALDGIKGSPKYGEVMNSVKGLSAELRTEYDDNPVTRTDITTDGESLNRADELRQKYLARFIKIQEAEEYDANE